MLVTTYYALLHLLRPHLEAAPTHSPDACKLSNFPAADSFLQARDVPGSTLPAGAALPGSRRLAVRSPARAPVAAV